MDIPFRKGWSSETDAGAAAFVKPPPAVLIATNGAEAEKWRGLVA